jgi:hypothetical protein
MLIFLSSLIDVGNAPTPKKEVDFLQGRNKNISEVFLFCWRNTPWGGGGAEGDGGLFILIQAVRTGE